MLALQISVLMVETVTAPLAQKQCDTVSSLAALRPDEIGVRIDLLDVLGFDFIAPLFAG